MLLKPRHLEPERYTTKVRLPVCLVDLVCRIGCNAQLFRLYIVQRNAVQGVYFAILIINENMLYCDQGGNQAIAAGWRWSAGG